jgi:Flp pilus assembly CpaE family ATPase
MELDKTEITMNPFFEETPLPAPPAVTTAKRKIVVSDELRKRFLAVQLASIQTAQRNRASARPILEAVFAKAPAQLAPDDGVACDTDGFRRALGQAADEVDQAIENAFAGVVEVPPPAPVFALEAAPVFAPEPAPVFALEAAPVFAPEPAIAPESLARVDAPEASLPVPEPATPVFLEAELPPPEPRVGDREIWASSLLEQERAHQEGPPPPVAEQHPFTPTTDGVDDARASERALGRVIVLFGCRGGAGTTTLAVNIASAFARAGKEACVLDFDLQLGDVFVALDLEPRTSLAVLAREVTTLDGSALKRRLERHPCGFFALAQTGRLGEADPEIADRVPDLLRSLAQHFDQVIIDGVRDFNDHALAALDVASEIALVVTQDVPSVRRAARVIALCRQLGYGDGKLRLVVNRYRRSSRISLAEVQNALEMPVYAYISNDFEAVQTAQESGVLLHDSARRTRVTRDVEALASRLILPDEEPRPSKRWLSSDSLISRLFARRAS